MDPSEKIEILRQYLLQRGCSPLECVLSGIVGTGENESFVAHFAQDSLSLPGEEHLQYFDTPSTICVAIETHSGDIFIHELM